MYPANPTARSEDGTSEFTNEFEVNTTTAIPISAHSGEGNLSTLFEADEFDFSTHVSVIHSILPPSLILPLIYAIV